MGFWGEIFGGFAGDTGACWRSFLLQRNAKSDLLGKKGIFFRGIEFWREVSRRQAVLMKMKGIADTVACLLFSVLGARGAVVQEPVVISPFSGSQSFTIADNVGGWISLGGQQICNRDVPPSYCYTSNILTGGSGVEFLLADANLLVRLSAGEVLSGTMASGAWGMSLLNRFETVLTSYSLNSGGVVHQAEEYFVGFRVRRSDGDYQYGWLEVAKNPNQGGEGPSTFRSIAYDDSGAGSLLIQGIPEPSTTLSLAGVLGLATRRRR